MIYLDHAATGIPRLREAVDAAREAAEWANPARGLHTLQAQSTAGVERAREAVGALAGGGTVCFTAGATHALNQAIGGLRPTPTRVAVDVTLHNAARRAVARLDASTWTLPHDAVGRIDLHRARSGWIGGTELVVCNHGSNVTGVVQPVAELADLAHRQGATMVVDCAQTSAHLRELDVGSSDLLALSAHKGLRSLPGVGALVVRGEVDLAPLLVGGVGFDAQSDEMPDELPARLEAGTANLPGIGAFGVAAQRARSHAGVASEQTDALREALARAGVEVHACTDLPLATFSVPGLGAREVEDALDRVFGVVVRAGLHCAPGAHRVLGTPDGAVRASLGETTTPEDLAALGNALEQLGRSLALSAQGGT